jgi:hypothetical protein
VDPRTPDLQKRKARHSPFNEARLECRTTGETLNACPFGCAEGDLDDYGYCHHLVGFTDAAERKTVECLVIARGRRAVDGRKREPVLRSDKIVVITTSARVYRDREPTDADRALLSALSDAAEADDEPESRKPGKAVGPVAPVKMSTSAPAK